MTSRSDKGFWSDEGALVPLPEELFQQPGVSLSRLRLTSVSSSPSSSHIGTFTVGPSGNVTGTILYFTGPGGTTVYFCAQYAVTGNRVDADSVFAHVETWNLNSTVTFVAAERHRPA